MSQYIRKFSLLIGDGANGDELSELRCVFMVSQQVTQSPTACTARIYNLSTQTISGLKGRRMVLSAGYDGSFGVIFDGTIIQKIVGRENPVDTFVEFLAVDSIAAYQNAKVHSTMAAGYTYDDLCKKYVESVGEHGVEAGMIPTFGGVKSPRGCVLYGQTRDGLRELADQSQSTWGFNQGKLDVIPNNYAPTDGTAVEVSASTGLIGSPQQTYDGIAMRVLLNPKIVGGQQGSMIHLSNATVVNQMRGNPGYQSTTWSGIYDADGMQVTTFPSVAEDGFYRVYSASHYGDTRGEVWYTDIIAVNPKGPNFPLGNSPFTTATGPSQPGSGMGG